MAEIKVFEYFETGEKGHLKKAREMLENLGAKNISYLPNGKPTAENCFISVSHSGGRCAVCVSELEVGVDIEKIGDRDFENVARKTFGEKEKEYYFNNKVPQSFFEIWTRKEAYSKISGEGIKEIIKGTDTFSLDGYEFETKISDGFVLTICEKKNTD